MQAQHDKPFTPPPSKTPEEIMQEATRKLAPEIRGAVRGMKISASAKFFFDALLDLSFLHCYGGSGRGKIFISIKDLSRLTRHNKDSITAWAEILIRERLIWVRNSWPKSEWRICAMCPAPVSAYNGHESDFIRGRAAALDTETEQSGSLPLGDAKDEKSPFAPVSAISSDTKRKDSASPSEGFRQSVRRIPPVRPKASDGKGDSTGETVRKLRTDSPKDSASLAEGVGESGGKLPQVSPKVSDAPSEGFRSNKETPLGEMEKGVEVGGTEAPPPAENEVEAAFKKWARTLDGEFTSKLEKRLEKLTEEARTAPTEEARLFVARKLREVRSRLNPKHPDQLKPKANAKPATATAKAALPGPGMVKVNSDEAAKLFAAAKKGAGI